MPTQCKPRDGARMRPADHICCAWQRVHSRHAPSFLWCCTSQTWKPGGKGGTEIGFGASVYPVAFILADFLERHPYLVRSKRVIELVWSDVSLRLAESNVTADMVSIQDPHREPPANCFVSTQRLRWGCTGDMEALLAASGSSSCFSSSCSCGGGDPSWDVIVGSDIAAFPYASAYEDLFQTIVSLAKSVSNPRSAISGSGRGEVLGEEHRRSCSSTANSQSGGADPDNHRSHGDGTCEEGESSKPMAPAAAGGHKVNNTNSRGERPAGEGVAKGTRKVFVLLAHKWRYNSEEAFFRAARESLSGSGDVGEEDVHPDFRDPGIRLHMSTVDKMHTLRVIDEYAANYYKNVLYLEAVGASTTSRYI